jgi:hypothetical protein
MANFEAIKLGGWAYRELLTETHANWIQESILKTANFADGCAVAPTAPVNVGGAGINITSVLQLTGVLDENTDNGDGISGTVFGSVKFRTSEVRNLTEASMNVFPNHSPTILVRYCTYPEMSPELHLLHSDSLGPASPRTWKIIMNSPPGIGVPRPISVYDEDNGYILQIQPYGFGFFIFTEGRWWGAGGNI